MSRVLISVEETCMKNVSRKEIDSILEGVVGDVLSQTCWSIRAYTYMTLELWLIHGSFSKTLLYVNCIHVCMCTPVYIDF